MKKVTLFISPAENQPGHHLVVVNGEGFFESVGKSVGAQIRGDDPWFDDKLFSVGTFVERILPDGGFTLSKIVPNSQLNEDWGRDEIYALVRVEGLSGSFKSNQITGYF